MPTDSPLSGLIPLSKCALQPYFSDRIQLADVIDWILRQSGKADIMISTFSTSEDFLRRLHRFRTSGLIDHCAVFCDLRAARKTVALSLLLRSVCDRVCLCQNHSKVILVSSPSLKVAVVTSQNQTRGDRFEAGVITTDPLTFANLSAGLDHLADNSISINDISLQS